MKAYGNVDSKFRFVILAAKRAKQLLQGAKPRIKSKSKNPIRIAQTEVREGRIDYELIDMKTEEIQEPAEEGFIGEEIGAEPEEMEKKEPQASKAKEAKPKKKSKAAQKKKPEKKEAEAKTKKTVKKSAQKPEKKEPAQKKKA